MDHLARPRGPTSRSLRVPYVCRNQPYDDGCFLTYPTRFEAQISKRNVRQADGKPAFWWIKHVLTAGGGTPLWWVDYNSPLSDDELASFFQSWIFFGLLHELLAPPGLYNDADYIVANKDDPTIHTGNLAVRVEAWLEWTRSLSHGEKEKLKLTLLRCLRVAHETMRVLFKSADKPGSGHPEFNRAVRTSVASVCETISALGELGLDVRPELLWPVFGLFATFDDTERNLMRQNGWCSSMIARAEKLFPTVAGHHYLLHMRQPPLGIDHRDCTEDGCQELQINTETYSTRHTDDACTCDALGPNISSITDALDNDTFPVLEVAGDAPNGVSAKAVRYHEGLAYVALSHVWVDGLGNPAANTLPRCQILRLQGLVKGLRGLTYTWGEEERTEKRDLHLWCDSLLCPIQEYPPPELDEEEVLHYNRRADVQRSRDLKVAALNKMRDVYEKASYVLVLDRALELLQIAQMDSLEATIRILTSRWMTRLWTFQEAALPEKLLIQFADQAVDFRDLAAQTKYSFQNNPLLRNLCRNASGGCVGLRSLHFLQESGGPNLLLFWDSLCLRRASYAADGPLCAAIILGLDARIIAGNSTHETRMAEFWRQLSKSSRGVPDDIIFNDFSRLSTPGFLWAPLSFQQPLTQVHYVLTNPFTAQKATLNDLGLRVLRPGWRLQLGRAPWAVRGNAAWDGFHTRNHGVLFARDQSGRWFSVTMSDQADANPETSLWNLLQGARTVEWYILRSTEEVALDVATRCILGFFKPHESGTQVFCSQMIVNVMLQAHYSLILQAAEKHAHELRRCNAWRLYQLWYTLDAMTASICRVAPHFAQRPLQYLRRRMSDWCELRLAQQLMSRGDVAMQTEEVAKAMSAAFSLPAPGGRMSISPASISLYIGIIFAGQVAIVDQTFGPSHEWCVG